MNTTPNQGMTTTNGQTALAAPQERRPMTLKDLLERAKGRLSAVMPKHLSADRLIKIALACVSRDKSGKLAQCTSDSILLAVMQAAELGLEIGGSLGDAYLVPYKKSWKDANGKWHSQMEAQCITGYRGLINLARRSGEISSVSAHVVHEKDTFRIVYGLEERLEHEPTFRGDPGEVMAAYAICRFKDGATQVEVMTVGQINDIRDRPKPGKAKAPPPTEGPWFSDYEEMCRKTVVRRLAKYLPLSPELRTQVEKEDEVEEANTIDVIAEAAASASLPETTPSKALAAKLDAKAPSAPTSSPEVQEQTVAEVPIEIEARAGEIKEALLNAKSAFEKGRAVQEYEAFVVEHAVAHEELVADLVRFAKAYTKT